MRKRPAQTVFTVAILIETTKVSYSFGKPLTKFESGAYAEHCSLECAGMVEAAKGIQPGLAQVTILASRDMELALRLADTKRPRAIAIGTYEYRKGANWCLVSMPFDSLWWLTPEIREGRLPYLILRGHKVPGGKISVHSLAFDTADNLEDHGLDR